VRDGALFAGVAVGGQAREGEAGGVPGVEARRRAGVGCEPRVQELGVAGNGRFGRRWSASVLTNFATEVCAPEKAFQEDGSSGNLFN